MVKYTHIIRRLLLTNFFSVFDHFVGLALKGLRCWIWHLTIKSLWCLYPEQQHIHQVFFICNFEQAYFLLRFFFRPKRKTSSLRTRHQHSSNPVNSFFANVTFPSESTRKKLAVQSCQWKGSTLKVLLDVLKFKHEDTGMTSFCRSSSVTIVNFK